MNISTAINRPMTPDQQIEFQLYETFSERALLATIMARPAWFPQIQQQVPADWFHLPGNRCVYDVMAGMAWQASASNQVIVDYSPMALYQGAQSLGMTARWDQETQRGEAPASVWALVQTVKPEQVWYTIQSLRAAEARIALYRQSCRIRDAALAGSSGIHAQRPDPIEIIDSAQAELMKIGSTFRSGSEGIQSARDTQLDLTGAKARGIQVGFAPMMSHLMAGYRPGSFNVSRRRGWESRSTMPNRRP